MNRIGQPLRIPAVPCLAQPVVTHTVVVPSSPPLDSASSPADPDALMRRLVAGDDQALGEIFDEYGSRCYTLARRLLGDGGLAEDAVQEALLGLWRAPERFDRTRGSLATFLLTLTHRRAVDVLRREALQRRGRVATDDGLAELPSQDAGTAEQAEARVQGNEVRQALKALPGPQREALLLAYFQGYTQREISSITGVPLGTVKTRMLAGVRTLRAQLGARYSLGDIR
jgi:RNA polymerase sigma factor (sigma-70 family)